jgi:hypothetical protein
MESLLVYLANFNRDPGLGDFVFVIIWAVTTLLIVSYYCYRMTQR